MKTLGRRELFFLIFALTLSARVWRAETNFQRQTGLFSNPAQGKFRVWVAEEPEVILDRQPGSHDTGRFQGTYESSVRETRAVCVLLESNGQTLPQAFAPKIRCSFRLPARPTALLSYGDEVEMEGKIIPPPSALNPGQFDYAKFLKNRGVAFVAYLSPGKWRKVPGAGPQGNFLFHWSASLRRWMEDRIALYLPYPENALLSGILLGQRGPLPGEMVESFLVTGTVHILAVSGMITAFVSGLFFLFFRALQLGRKGAAFGALLCLGFFVLVTGAHPPVCRAGLFSGLALLAILLERRARAGTLLLVTGGSLVLWNPRVVEDLSFQISFLATAGLMVLASRILEKLGFLWKPAALLMASTLAAQLSVWCLLIFIFNQVSPYSVPANLVVVPLALFSVAAGLTMVLGSIFHPFLGKIFAASCEVALKLLTLLAGKISAFPKANFIVGSPPGEWVLAYHFFLLVLFYFYWPRMKPESPSQEWIGKQSFYRRGQKLSLRLFVGFLAVSVLGWSVGFLKSKPFRVIFLAVGHGNAVVVENPKGQVFVCDGGKETQGPARYQLLVAYLRHEGITQVESLLDTHPDSDHVGGLVNLASCYPVGQAYEGWNATADTEIYKKFKDTLAAKKIPLRELREGDHLADLEPAVLSILHPPASFEPRLHADNNRSVVSLISFPTARGDFSLLLPGDLEKEGLRELLKNNSPFPNVDWLMAPHHGRKSGEPALCAAGFQPRFVVLSDWKDYPLDHLLYKAQVPGSVVLSTAVEGAIEVEMYPNGLGRYRSFLGGEWKELEAVPPGLRKFSGEVDSLRKGPI